MQAGRDSPQKRSRKRGKMGRRSMPTRWELLPSRLEVSADARALMMLRVAAALVAFSQLALTVAALMAHRGTASLAAFLYCFNILIGLLFVRLTFYRWMLTLWRPAALLGAVLLLISVASVASLNAEPELFFITG